MTPVDERLHQAQVTRRPGAPPPFRAMNLLRGTVYFLLASPLGAAARSLAAAPSPGQALALPTSRSGCQPMALADKFLLPDGFTAAPILEWGDADCAPRRAALLSNEALDPSGHFGGVLHEVTYRVNGADVVCTGTTGDHPGVGNSVNHYQLPDGTFGSDTSLDHPGESETLFAGPHHFLHAYRWSYLVNGHNLTLTAHWLFGTGLSHPVVASTYDLSATPANALNADVRMPYGDIDFDGGLGTNVTGVEWGADYKFQSLPQNGVNLLQDGWTNNVTNSVPYVLVYSAAADREMGYVSTHTLAEQDAGAGGFYTQGGMSNPKGPMPVDYDWVHQAGQYDYATTPQSKRLGWQLNYGAAGQVRYDDFLHKQKLSGWPYQSHSVSLVFGARSRRAVQMHVAHVEAMASANLTAHSGVQVSTRGPAGIERSDVVSYVPAGYSKVYGSLEFAAQGTQGVVDFDIHTTQGTLQAFVARVQAWPSADLPSLVRVNGQELQSGVAGGYFASLDSVQRILWLTITPSQPQSLEVFGHKRVGGIVVGAVAAAAVLGTGVGYAIRCRWRAHTGQAGA